MKRAPVVPHEHIAHLPFVAVDELFLGAEGDELLDEPHRPIVWHADDALYGSGAHPERLAAISGMRPYQRMKHVRVGGPQLRTERHAAVLAGLHEILVAVVQNESIQLTFAAFR